MIIMVHPNEVLKSDAISGMLLVEINRGGTYLLTITLYIEINQLTNKFHQKLTLFLSFVPIQTEKTQSNKQINNSYFLKERKHNNIDFSSSRVSDCFT